MVPSGQPARAPEPRARLAGQGPGGEMPDSAEVMFEKRSVRVENGLPNQGVIRDRFEGYDVHVYRLMMAQER